MLCWFSFFVTGQETGCCCCCCSNISKVNYLVSSGTLNLNSVDQMSELMEVDTLNVITLWLQKVTDEAGTKLAVESYHTEDGTKLSLHGVSAAWLLLMLLLSRAHNIPLIALITLQHTCCRYLVTHLCRHDNLISPVSVTLIYLFMAHAAFFYQVSTAATSSVTEYYWILC